MPKGDGEMFSVLILDDNKPTADRICNSLPWEKLSCQVVSTLYNGKQGREAIIKYKPDIIITDVQMPGLSGLRVIELTRDIIPNSKIIFISAYDNFEYAYKAIKLQVQDYLLKPFTNTDLINVVKKAIEDLSTQKEHFEFNEKRLKEPSFEKQIITYLQENAGSKITLENVAKYFDMSPSYMCRVIKQKTGNNFAELVTLFRIERAKRLLQNPGYHIDEIAELVGYKNYLTFYKVFTRETGISPTTYRKEEEEDLDKN